MTRKDLIKLRDRLLLVSTGFLREYDTSDGVTLKRDQLRELLDHIDEQQRKVDRLSKRVQWFESSGGVAVHAEVFTVRAERDRLKVLMHDAYYEGYRDGELGERGPTQSWDRSDTRAELEESDD